ncbi:MAG: cysteine desulfurase family protein [Bacteroidales bacterium]
MEKDKQVIYLDNNASTPLDKKVLEAMLPYFSEIFANSNSTHLLGRKAYDAVKVARKQVSELIGSDANEIVFTSGATESINLAIKGIAESYIFKGKHIVTVSTEHSAVIDTCRYLESKGFELTYLTVDNHGLIDLNELKSVIRDDTILVTVMYVNNETGVIQPIREIADITHGKHALFMSDCTQAVGKIPINVDDLGIDLMCFSGHKMYAPKGIGALYVRQRNTKVKISPLLHGGGHEGGLRSGTLNVTGIVGLGMACEIAQVEMNLSYERILKLRNKLEAGLLRISGTFLNGSVEKRIFHVSNICFRDKEASILIAKMKNIAVSNGSACSSMIIEPSHVLKAMGLSDDDSFSSIRFSLGKFNTEVEIDEVVKRFKEEIGYC